MNTLDRAAELIRLHDDGVMISTHEVIEVLRQVRNEHGQMYHGDLLDSLGVNKREGELYDALMKVVSESIK